MSPRSASATGGWASPDAAIDTPQRSSVMFTVCPKCALTLVVTTEDLRVAQGYVRCGRCSSVFNALARLTEEGLTSDESVEAEPPASAASQTPPPAPSNPPPQGATDEDAIPEDAPPPAARNAPPPPPRETPPPAARKAPPPPPQETPPPAARKAPPPPPRETPSPSAREAAPPPPRETSRPAARKAAPAPPRETPPPAAREPAPPAPRETAPPAPTPPAAAQATPPAAAQEAARPAARGATPLAGPAPEAPVRVRSALSQVRAPRKMRLGEDLSARTGTARLLPHVWRAGSGLAVLLLLAQIVNHYRDELAATARFHRPITALYASLGIPLAPRWDLRAYEVRQLGASVEPASAGLMTVRASVKNAAAQAQPLPVLRVTLQDRFGNRIAARDVAPAMYLPHATPGSAFLSAGQRIDAEMGFVDPGANAVGSEIDGCLPASGGEVTCANDAIAR